VRPNINPHIVIISAKERRQRTYRISILVEIKSLEFEPIDNENVAIKNCQQAKYGEQIETFSEHFLNIILLTKLNVSKIK
jgi:hypothetical protein